MNPLLPGQIVLARYGGLVGIVVCDHRENVPLGGVAFEIRGGIHRNSSDGFSVPVVSVMLRINAGGDERFYVGWVNELEDGVVESLAIQPQLPIMFATPLYERVGTTVIHNGLRQMMQKQLGTISLLADKSPWTPEQFAEARAVVETQFPTAVALWARLGGE
jgi:hypothetical protein